MNYGFTCFYNNGHSGLGGFARKIELDTAEKHNSLCYKAIRR